MATTDFPRCRPGEESRAGGTPPRTVHQEGNPTMPGQPTSGRIYHAVGHGYGPHRLVADAIAAMAAHGVCPVFTARDLPRALAGAREILAALHLPTAEAIPLPSDVESGGDGS